MAEIPLEEIAYRNRPPLLEDASIRGPTRTPVKGAMLTLEERDAIEADHRWYRYSKFALPWLLYILALAATVFGLTCWQAVGDYRWFGAETFFNTEVQKSLGFGVIRRQGLPMTIVTIAESNSDLEAGFPKTLRNVRIAQVFIAFVAVIFTLLTLVCKPRPKSRTGINIIWAILFIAAGVLACISFAWGIARSDDAQRCPRFFTLTFEKCEPKVWKATIQLVLDILLAMGCFFSAILLIMYTLSGDWRLQRQGWRERERDAEQERPKQKDPRHLALHNIRNVRVTFLTIVLLFTLAVAIVDAVFIVYLHEDRTKTGITENLFASTPAVANGFAVGARGDSLNVQPGWSARNTRLRWALSIITILTVLINLIPFTHRLLAYIFAFFYFSAAVMAFVSFAFDIHEMKNADKFMGAFCRRNGLKCVKSAYIATAIMEFFLGLALLFYVFYEICFKCCPFAKSRHSKRAYAVHERKKHDRALDSLRPVRCEITGRVMTAKEYVYRWRFIAGTAQEVDYVPLYPRVPLYAAEGYVPEQYIGTVAGAAPVQALY
jgi:hypothetical protein